MKFSEALVLGYSEIKHNPGVWLWQNKDGSCEGCAIGAALYAQGLRSAYRPISGDSMIIPIMERLWPWTLGKGIDFIGKISKMFTDVTQGKTTIEELVAWVKSVEPEEESNGNTGVDEAEDGSGVVPVAAREVVGVCAHSDPGEYSGT
jgi:hypothetical protein